MRCRGNAAREPSVSNAKRWSSRSLSSWIDIDRSRGAASSIANGMPSSLAQIDATQEAFSAVRSKSGRASFARVRKRRTPSYREAVSGVNVSFAPGTASDGTLSYDQALLDVATDAQLVLSEQIRHSILQVTHA